MKKLLLSVAILIGATLILSQDDSDNSNDVIKEDVAIVQSMLPSNS